MERDAKGLAIVIRSIPVRDYDRLLTLFSPSLGLMNVVSYGSRKSVRSVKAPLYTEGNFSLEKGRRGWSLKDIDVISTHDYLYEEYFPSAGDSQSLPIPDSSCAAILP